MVLQSSGIVIHADWILVLDALEIESRRLFPIFRNALADFVHYPEMTTRGPIACLNGVFKENLRHPVSLLLTQVSELARTVVVALTDQSFRMGHAQLGQRKENAD